MPPATHPAPLNDEVDAVPLLQDPLQLGNSVGAGTLEGDLVRDAHDLHGLRVAGNLPVGDGHHVVQSQGFRWKAMAKLKAAGHAGAQDHGRHHLPPPGTPGHPVAMLKCQITSSLLENAHRLPSHSGMVRVLPGPLRLDGTRTPSPGTLSPSFHPSACSFLSPGLFVASLTCQAHTNPRPFALPLLFIQMLPTPITRCFPLTFSPSVCQMSPHQPKTGPSTLPKLPPLCPSPRVYQDLPLRACSSIHGVLSGT